MVFQKNVVLKTGQFVKKDDLKKKRKTLTTSDETLFTFEGINLIQNNFNILIPINSVLVI